MNAIIFLAGGIVRCISGLINIILDIHKLSRLLLILALVGLDLMFFVSSPLLLGEAMIHMLILTMPIAYILKN